MTDEQRDVRADSDALLRALNRMKDAEQRKRLEPISTPAFHQLADEVAARADEVWATAKREKLDGEAAETTGATIDDVATQEPDPPG